MRVCRVSVPPLLRAVTEACGDGAFECRSPDYAIFLQVAQGCFWKYAFGGSALAKE